MGALLNVEIARSASRGELPSALRTILRPVFAGAIAIAVYGCVVALAPASALGLLFRSRSPYLQLAPELRLFVVASLLGYAGQMLSEMLIGLRETRAAFISQCWSSAACIAAGFPLLYATGALGAVIGLIAAHLARIAVVGAFLRRILRRVSNTRAPEPAFAADSLA
jgi:O-antigen/teichoic acid export membrane protein